LKTSAWCPSDVLVGWFWSAGPWPQLTIVQFIDCATGVGAGGEDLGHDDVVVVVEAKCAPVKELVVQHAQGQAVIERVRPIEGEPLHVGSLYTGRDAAESSVVAAEGALVIPGLEDLHTPGRITPTFLAPPLWIRQGVGRLEHLSRIETDCGQHIRRDGVWEVAGDQAAGNGEDELWIGPQCSLQRCLEAADDVALGERANRIHRNVVVELPNAVRP
jgi:hypothetical protein